MAAAGGGARGGSHAHTSIRLRQQERRVSGGGRNPSTHHLKEDKIRSPAAPPPSPGIKMVPAARGASLSQIIDSRPLAATPHRPHFTDVHFEERTTTENPRRARQQPRKKHREQSIDQAWVEPRGGTQNPVLPSNRSALDRYPQCRDWKSPAREGGLKAMSKVASHNAFAPPCPPFRSLAWPATHTGSCLRANGEANGEARRDCPGWLVPCN